MRRSSECLHRLVLHGSSLCNRGHMINSVRELHPWSPREFLNNCRCAYVSLVCNWSVHKSVFGLNAWLLAAASVAGACVLDSARALEHARAFACPQVFCRPWRLKDFWNQPSATMSEWYDTCPVLAILSQRILASASTSQDW